MKSIILSLLPLLAVSAAARAEILNPVVRTIECRDQFALTDTSFSVRVEVRTGVGIGGKGSVVFRRNGFIGEEAVAGFDLKEIKGDPDSLFEPVTVSASGTGSDQIEINYWPGTHAGKAQPHRVAVQAMVDMTTQGKRMLFPAVCEIPGADSQ